MNKIIATTLALAGLLGIVATAHATDATSTMQRHTRSSATVSVDGSETAVQPYVAPARHHVTIHPGTLRLWTCGPEQVSMVGGTYRTCEWSK